MDVGVGATAHEHGFDGGRVPTPAFLTVAAVAAALDLSLDDLPLRVHDAVLAVAV